MTQSRAQKYAEKAIKEERIEELVFYLLLLVKALHDKVGQHKTNEPAQGVPANGEPKEVKSLNIGVPKDVVKV